MFNTSYGEAHRRGYRDLEPATRFNVDYATTGITDVEALLRRLRNDMTGAGLRVESSKGECNDGQFEVAFRYDEALRTADNHAVYKAGAKEIAAQLGQSLTFMAKYDAREGNSCHIHLSVRSTDGAALMADAGGRSGLSTLGEQWLAGQVAALGELALICAPTSAPTSASSGTFAQPRQRGAVTAAPAGCAWWAGAWAARRVPGGGRQPVPGARRGSPPTHGSSLHSSCPTNGGQCHTSDREHVPAAGRSSAAVREQRLPATFGDRWSTIRPWLPSSAGRSTLRSPTGARPLVRADVTIRRRASVKYVPLARRRSRLRSTGSRAKPELATTGVVSPGTRRPALA